MAQPVIEGTWEEVVSHAEQFVGRRVRLIVLPEESPMEVAHATSVGRRRVSFGMFKGLIEPTDEDFRSAEFHGDPDDGLDWA